MNSLSQRTWEQWSSSGSRSFCQISAQAVVISRPDRLGNSLSTSFHDDWQEALPHGPLHGAALDMAAHFPRVSDPRNRIRDNKQEAMCLSRPCLRMTCYHFCCILLVTQTDPDTMRKETTKAMSPCSLGHLGGWLYKKHRIHSALHYSVMSLITSSGSSLRS